MPHMIRTLVLLAAFGLWSAVLTAKPLQPQTSNKDAVTVKVTPLKIDGAVWEFEVVFDTHSQELSDDLPSAAVLMGPNGSQFKPLDWKGDPPSGHHRKGILRFNAINPPPDVLELRIVRPKEAIQRIFRWPVPRQ